MKRYTQRVGFSHVCMGYPEGQEVLLRTEINNGISTTYSKNNLGLSRWHWVKIGDN